MCEIFPVYICVSYFWQIYIWSLSGKFKCEVFLAYTRGKYFWQIYAWGLSGNYMCLGFLANICVRYFWQIYVWGFWRTLYKSFLFCCKSLKNYKSFPLSCIQSTGGGGRLFACSGWIKISRFPWLHCPTKGLEALLSSKLHIFNQCSKKWWNFRMLSLTSRLSWLKTLKGTHLYAWPIDEVIGAYHEH